MSAKQDHEVTFQPPPTGLQFMLSDAKVRMIKGPVGSGKSTVCINEIFKRCAEMPKCRDGFRRSRWVIIRNTNQQLKTTTKKSWDQWYPDGIFGRWKESEKTFFLDIGEIKAEVLFLPLDTPDDAARLLSLELTGAFINETREVAPEIVQAVFSRLGRYPSRAMLPVDPQTGKKVDYWYGLIMDTNPPSRDSWLYEQFEEVKPEGWESFHQPGGLDQHAENVENLPTTYYTDMMNGATQDWIDVHVHGKYGKSIIGRPVFEESFKREFHVAKEPLKATPSEQYTVLIGMDFGRTPAAVMGQRDWRGRLNILDALYVENIGLENFLNKHLKPLLKEKFPYNKYLVVGDPAGWAKSQLSEENAYDVLKKCGFSAVRSPTNDVTPRIAAVESLLAQQVDGAAMMLFGSESTSPGMKHLISAMDGGYKYKRKTDGSYETSPQKDRFSHCFPSGVVVSTPNGGVTIEALRPGDLVSTPFGARRVSATMSREAVDFVELSFDDGTKLVVTTDHPIYTLAGIVLSEAVQYTSVLLSEGENTCAQQNTLSLSSTVSGSIENLAGTTKRTSESMGACTCTGMCGNKPTEQYLKVSKCTTGITTRLTTELRTLSAYLRAITSGITARSVLQKTLSGLKTALLKLGSLLRTGTGQLRGLRGTQSTVSELGLGGSAKHCCARTAASRLNVFVEQTSAGIVALRAKEWLGSSPGSTTLLEPALYAAVTSELINTARLKHAPKIVGVRRYRSPKPEAVYDLTVDEVHSFFADGLWVSNCADAIQYLCLGANMSGGTGQVQAKVVEKVNYQWV